MARLMIRTTHGVIYPAESFKELLDKDYNGSYMSLYNRFMKRLKAILDKQPDIIFSKNMLKKVIHTKHFDVKMMSSLTATVLIIDGVQMRLRDWYAENGNIEKHDCQSQVYIRFLNRVTALINKNASTAVTHEQLLDKLDGKLDPIAYNIRPLIVDEVMELAESQDLNFQRGIIPLWKPTRLNF